jgi:Coenzyme PQQ synthesis protein D (PqqD)
MPHLTRHPEVVYTDLDDGAVLLHGDTKFFYSLNQVGAAVWRSLASTETLDDLVDRLLAEYDVDREHARATLSAFVRILEEEQLIVTDQAPSEAKIGTEPNTRGSDAAVSPAAHKRAFVEPELIKHDEPLHAVVMNPFDPKLPLAE